MVLCVLQDVILKKYPSCEYKTADVMRRASGFYSNVCVQCIIGCARLQRFYEPSHIVRRQSGCERNITQIDACL